MDKQYYLISRLADGNFHSGETMAAALGISRTAVWKHIKTLADVELDVYSVNGKGHRLSQALELLDPVKIRSSMTASAIDMIDEFKVLAIQLPTKIKHIH